MKEKDKTKEELINELVELRQRVTKLEALEIEGKRTEDALRKRTHDLGERVKELNFFFALSELIEKQDISLEEIFQGIVNLIPPAWQYAEITCARITVDGQEFRTENFRETYWKLARDINVHGDQIGSMEVCYLEERPEGDEGPFQKEERSLINAIAERLGKIIERKRGEEALRKSSEELKFFAYSVMHDLKSPTVAIHGLTERLYNQLKDDTLSVNGKNYCDQILRASVQVAALIEKINVYITTKETPLKIEKINLREILEIVKDEFSPRLTVRRIELLEPKTTVEFKADRLSMLRAFRNFVDNALKYGGGELSEISIGYNECDEFYTFSVHNNGDGIRGGDHERIFLPFQRGETSKTIEGTGLGLAIVREIADRHRGSVWAESGLEEGTVFYISVSKHL
jgi:signal transduction histidine kinase